MWDLDSHFYNFSYASSPINKYRRVLDENASGSNLRPTWRELFWQVGLTVDLWEMMRAIQGPIWNPGRQIISAARLVNHFCMKENFVTSSRIDDIESGFGKYFSDCFVVVHLGYWGPFSFYCWTVKASNCKVTVDHVPQVGRSKTATS